MAKRKFAQNYQRAVESMDEEVKTRGAFRGQKRTNVVNIKQFSHHKSKPVTLIPKSIKQEEYIDLLLDPDKLIIFATGVAGTGKTMLAVLAAVKAFKEGEIDKIIITRPAVAVDDEKHGFLPGTLNEKMEPWTKPIFDVMKEYYSPREIATMLEDETIEISPLAFMRGRTLKRAFIICDEMQSSSINQMKMILTRIGDDSKMVLTGDLDQTDRKFNNCSGLMDFMNRISTYSGNSIAKIEFSEKDIQRHFIIKEILSIYKDD